MTRQTVFVVDVHLTSHSGLVSFHDDLRGEGGLRPSKETSHQLSYSMTARNRASQLEMGCRPLKPCAVFVTHPQTCMEMAWKVHFHQLFHESTAIAGSALFPGHRSPHIYAQTVLSSCYIASMVKFICLKRSISNSADR